jgi:hypothetical protein
MLIGALTALCSAMTALTRRARILALRESSAGYVGIVLVGLAGGSPATIAAGVLLLSVTLLAGPALLLIVAAEGEDRPAIAAALPASRGVLFLIAAVLLGSGVWGQAELLTALAEPVPASDSRAAGPEAADDVISAPPILIGKLERARPVAFWLVVAGLPLASCASARAYFVTFRSRSDASDRSRRVATSTESGDAGNGAWLSGALVLKLVLAALAPLAISNLPELSAKAWTGDPLTLGLTLIGALFGVVLAWMWCAGGGEAAMNPPTWFLPLAQISSDRFTTTSLFVAVVVVPLRAVSLILAWLLDAGPRVVISLSNAVVDLFCLEESSQGEHAEQVPAVLIVLSTAVLLFLTLWLTV